MSFIQRTLQPETYMENYIETGSLWFTQSLLEFYKLDKLMKGYNQPHLWGPTNFIFNDKDRIEKFKSKDKGYDVKSMFYILDENLRNGNYRPKENEAQIERDA